MLKTIKLILNNSEKFYVKQINNILFFKLNYKSYYINTVNSNKLKKFFSDTFITFFLRITWRGKAYRVRFFKNYNKFTFNFGHSHWCKLIFKKNLFNFSKIKRQNYIIFFKHRLDKFYAINIINNIREMSKYTKRGIKVKKTPYIKRFGKISQVSSSLHSF